MALDLMTTGTFAQLAVMGILRSGDKPLTEIMELTEQMTYLRFFSDTSVGGALADLTAQGRITMTQKRINGILTPCYHLPYKGVLYYKMLRKRYTTFIGLMQSFLDN